MSAEQSIVVDPSLCEAEGTPLPDSALLGMRALLDRAGVELNTDVTVLHAYADTLTYQLTGNTHTGNPAIGESDSGAVAAVDPSRRVTSLSKWLFYRLTDANALDTDAALNTLLAGATVKSFGAEAATSEDGDAGRATAIRDLASSVGELLFSSGGAVTLKRFIKLEETTYNESLALSGAAITLRPSPVAIDPSAWESPILQQMHEPWSPSNYSTPRRPINVGASHQPELFAKPDFAHRINGMALKLPGETELTVPVELAQFVPGLQQILDYEYAINPNAADYYAYISIKQGVLTPGKAQGVPVPEVHVDGIQGMRYPEKLPPEQTYLMTNDVPTRYYPQAFNMEVDPAVVDFRTLFAEQADIERSELLETNTIYLIDPYVVHQATFATRETLRTLVRVEFSRKRYDSVGDTLNPILYGRELLDGGGYPWERVPRPHPRSLIGYKQRERYFAA